MDTYLIAVDTSKNIFEVRAVDRMGKSLLERRLSREAFKRFVSTQASTTIAIEVGQGSHYWGRFFREHGHEARLIPAAFVKPFVKSQKNDRADAEGIAEAALRPNMRFVSVKSTRQQDLQNLHRVRERIVKQRTMLCNQLRGLMAEYGIILPKGIDAIKRLFSETLELHREALSGTTIITFQELYAEFRAFTLRLTNLEARIRQEFSQSEACKRLATIPGIGVLSATAIVATAVDPTQCKNGRQFAAALGLVPRQFSSGGKTVLGGITKRGNPYLRKLLVHGARSVLQRIGTKKDNRSLWLQKTLASKGMRRAAVALANKNARVVWTLLTKPDVCYVPQF